MSWKSENAVKKLYDALKRFKKQNLIIYKSEIDALKIINTELENSNRKYVNDNILFAKLLVYVLDRNLHHNGDIKACIKIASNIIKEPLDYHLQMFHNNLNQKGIDNYLQTLGFNLDHLDSSERKQINNDKILKENEKEIIEKLKINWTFENVNKSFYNTANEFLKDIDNYK